MGDGIYVSGTGGHNLIRQNFVHDRDGDGMADGTPVIQDRRYGLGGKPLLSECQANHNLYYCFEDQEWGRKHLEREQRLGAERESVSADPLFVDFEKGDFCLKPESPAPKLGFKSVDMSAIGLPADHSDYRRTKRLALQRDPSSVKSGSRTRSQDD